MKAGRNAVSRPRPFSTGLSDAEYSELEDSTLEDGNDMLSDMGHIQPSNNQLYGTYPQSHPPRARSEIGHGSSSISTSRPLNRETRSTRTFSFSRSLNRLHTDPVDSRAQQSTDYDQSGRHPPRKLRKNPRMSSVPVPTSAPSFTSLPPPSAYKPPPRSSQSSSVSSSPVSVNAPKPPPRKLTKRNSRTPLSQRSTSTVSVPNLIPVPPLPIRYQVVSSIFLSLANRHLA